MSNEITYQNAVSELEDILASLENEDTGIDELSDKLKRAAQLMDFCKAKLKSTEEEVNKILAGMNDAGA